MMVKGRSTDIGPEYLLIMPIPLLWTTLIGKNTINQKRNTDAKSIDIAHCKRCKNILFGVENLIVKKYY